MQSAGGEGYSAGKVDVVVGLAPVAPLVGHLLLVGLLVLRALHELHELRLLVASLEGLAVLHAAPRILRLPVGLLLLHILALDAALLLPVAVVVLLRLLVVVSGLLFGLPRWLAVPIRLHLLLPLWFPLLRLLLLLLLLLVTLLVTLLLWLLPLLLGSTRAHGVDKRRLNMKSTYPI